MLLNQKLVTLGQFDLRLNHLLIIAILVLSFSTSFLLRTQAAEFGSELNEFDPFFNFRATEYIVENGIDGNRLKTIGYGKDRPMVSNDDEKDGRELNRRVEFKILEK